jgi:DnaJ-class molecular chaperone
MIILNDNEKPIWMRQQNQETIVICQTCRDTGLVRVITDNPSYQGPYKKECNACDGEGRVGKMVTIEHEKLTLENVNSYQP